MLSMLSLSSKKLDSIILEHKIDVRFYLSYDTEIFFCENVTILYVLLCYYVMSVINILRVQRSIISICVFAATEIPILITAPICLKME